MIKIILSIASLQMSSKRRSVNSRGRGRNVETSAGGTAGASTSGSTKGGRSRRDGGWEEFVSVDDKLVFFSICLSDK
jgi:hypothetical protein